MEASRIEKETVGIVNYFANFIADPKTIKFDNGDAKTNMLMSLLNGKAERKGVTENTLIILKKNFTEKILELFAKGRNIYFSIDYNPDMNLEEIFQKTLDNPDVTDENDIKVLNRMLGTGGLPCKTRVQAVIVDDEIKCYTSEGYGALRMGLDDNGNKFELPVENDED